MAVKSTGLGSNFAGVGSGVGDSKMAGKVAAALSSLSPDVELHAVSGNGVSGSSNGVIIPIIRSKDNIKQLPTYYTAMQRAADEQLAVEDLDNIQFELETLLSSVSLRARVLKQEYESIDKDEKRSDRHIKDKQPLSPAPGLIANGGSGNLGASSQGIGGSSSGSTLNGKRKRDETAYVRTKHSSVTIVKQEHRDSKHAKNSPHTVHTDDSLDDMPTTTGSGNKNSAHSNHSRSEYELPVLSVPKNDMPNKFWLSVEPYCKPLTNEDLRLIDELLEQNKGPLEPPVPMLDESITGPLTQRLVSAFIEEQMISHPSEQAAVGEHSNSSSSENTSHNFRSLPLLKNCFGIENRIKKELIEQGILDKSDFLSNDDDEVLHEIKRISAEISSVSLFNSGELKQLRVTAVNEIKCLELKRKLEGIDQEMSECYKRMQQNRVKRKGFTLDEQQEIYRLISEQRSLAEQLERMHL